MEKRPKHARSRSFTGGAIVSFFKSTAASFSATTTTSSAVPVHGRSSFNHRNAFSGPIVSIVPPEARRGGRKGSRGENRSGYRTPEPSSPKVSCIGQIKKAKANKVKACCKNGACPLPPKPPADQGRIRPKSSLVKRMLFRRSRSRSSSSSSSSSRDSFFKSTAVAAAPAAPAPAGLGQMKRFTSGRAAFEDFDWREAERTAPIDYDDDDEVLVAHSAPLVLGGGLVASEPRKEVNLWSRRPVAPPTPLRLTRK